MKKKRADVTVSKSFFFPSSIEKHLHTIQVITDKLVLWSFKCPSIYVLREQIGNCEEKQGSINSRNNLVGFLTYPLFKEIEKKKNCAQTLKESRHSQFMK